MNPGRARLGDLLDRAIDATGGLDARLHILREAEREDIVVDTDLDRLVQVFINLIANCRKYCDAPQPELRIDVTQQDDTVQVVFADNGTGVPEELQSIIFEKFVRVGETKAGGAGLGLAICREIMTRLRGEIVCLPKQQGGGFLVSFPVAGGLQAAGENVAD